MLKNFSNILVFSVVLIWVGCSKPVGPSQPSGSKPTKASSHPAPSELAGYHQAVFASGCFWCVEAVFESMAGVQEVVSGYAGGSEQNPTYEQVGSGRTGHAEAILIYYDSSQVDFPKLLRIYFNSMDPTQVNGQGPDIGRQYRSVIFYKNETEKRLAEAMIAQLNGSGDYADPIAVEVAPEARFWPAEGYHQNYVENNPNQPYVVHESIPRLRKAQSRLADLLKKP